MLSVLYLTEKYFKECGCVSEINAHTPISPLERGLLLCFKMKPILENGFCSHFQGREFLKQKPLEELTEKVICGNPLQYGEPFLHKPLLSAASK